MRSDREPPVPGRSRRRTSLRRSLALIIGLAALLGQSTPARVNAADVWTVNLFTSRAFLYQNPYATACTAASTMIMLNVIAYAHTGGDGFRWTPYRIKNNTANRSDVRDMTSILWFARSHDTLSLSGSGSDGHGWRNALNYYGWGSNAMTDPSLSVYDDLEYTSYDAAVHAAVVAIARFRMPVGIVSWAGRHAQVMTGYIVTGEDPAVSDAFVVRYVYLSDPLYSDHYVNLRLTNNSFKAGTLRLRFQAYRETDSPYDDGLRPGWRRSSVSPTRGPSEWYRRWVIIAPVRAGLPAATPAPTPTPSADPSSPADQPSAEPAQAPASSVPPPSASPSPNSSPSPSAGPSPSASPAPSASPEPSPTATATA